MSPSHAVWMLVVSLSFFICWIPEINCIGSKVFYFSILISYPPLSLIDSFIYSISILQEIGPRAIRITCMLNIVLLPPTLSLLFDMFAYVCVYVRMIQCDLIVFLSCYNYAL